MSVKPIIVTWTDLERRALFCPYVYNALYGLGRNLSREDVLIHLAYSLSHAREQLQQALAEEIARNPNRRAGL